MEKRISLLEVNWARYEEHHRDIKITLDKIWSKLSSLPCDTHLGDRKVLSEKVSGMDTRLTIAWTFIFGIIGAIVTMAFRIVAGG
jgi:hypothetical protein